MSLLVHLLALALAAGPTAGKEFEVPARPLAWSELSPERFDRRWSLPDPRTAPGRDLLAESRRLLALRFEVTDELGNPLRSFGDLVRVAAALPRGERRSWWRGVQGRAPELARDWGAGMTELLFDQRLATERWSPDQTHPNDGILSAESWPLAEEPRAPWSELPANAAMEQSSTLFHADLAAIKAAESDYRAYPDNVGAAYEEIYPLPGYYVGTDPAGRPFSTLRLHFRCDLPFPFSDYTTRLHILSRFDGSGVLVTDIYSTTSDFHWLAGRDVLLPVTSSDGEWVAYLLVRHFGFDLDGVPDGPEDRRVALRGALGNLKRNAEELYRRRSAAGGAPRNDPEALSRTRVLGRR